MADENQKVTELKSEEGREIVIEILHEKEGEVVVNKAPIKVTVERIQRGFRVVTSPARCM